MKPGEDRHLYWNFVSSSLDRLWQAAENWQAGWIRLPDGDDLEFTALPDDARVWSPPPAGGAPHDPTRIVRGLLWLRPGRRPCGDSHPGIRATAGD